MWDGPGDEVGDGEQWDARYTCECDTPAAAGDKVGDGEDEGARSTCGAALALESDVGAGGSIVLEPRSFRRASSLEADAGAGGSAVLEPRSFRRASASEAEDN